MSAGVLAGPTSKLAATHAEPNQLLPRGEVLRRALREDASQEYLLYLPERSGGKAPLFVAVHGFSRNVEEHAARFAPFAERYGVILVAPFFGGERDDDYQRLGRTGRGRRSDLALDAIVEEVATLTGGDAGKIHLFGFSGGAQFAHRYVLAHPDRVARAVVGAAGWYTFPDFETPYPYGLASPDLPGVTFEPEKFLRIPISVVVGDHDSGSENLRRNPDVDRQQGTTRRERARNWVSAMRRAAEKRGLEPLVTYEPVAGIGHSFKEFMTEGGLGVRVFEALFGSPRSASETEVRIESGRSSASR